MGPIWYDCPMSYDVDDGDLVLCVDASPNHVTGDPVPLVRGETYRVWGVMPYLCPCGRTAAMSVVAVGFACCKTRYRLLRKPKSEKKERETSAPKEIEKV